MATSPISQLPKIIDKHHKRVLRAGIAAGKTGLARAQEAAVLTTRVDTGRARSNWVASIGSPSSQEIPPYAPGNNLGKGERANAIAAIDQGKRVARRWNLTKFPFAFIANNVPYIGILDAKDSMLAVAVQIGSLSIREAFIQHLKTGRR